jgi:hypothetical protein
MRQYGPTLGLSPKTRGCDEIFTAVEPVGRAEPCEARRRDIQFSHRLLRTAYGKIATRLAALRDYLRTDIFRLVLLQQRRLLPAA